MMGSSQGLSGSDTMACSGWMASGESSPISLEDARRAAGHGAQHALRGDVAARGAHARHRAIAHVNPENLGVLVNLDALTIGAARVAPGDRVVPRDRAGLVIQRAQDRRVTAAIEIDLRHELLHVGRVDHLGAHAEMFVDLGAPARGAQVRIRMRQREMPARGIEQVEVEFLGAGPPRARGWRRRTSRPRA